MANPHQSSAEDVLRIGTGGERTATSDGPRGEDRPSSRERRESGFRPRDEERGGHSGGATRSPPRARRRESLAQVEWPGEQLVTIARGVAREVTRHMGRNPATSLAIAFGVGVVLGGGLSLRVGRLALVAAGRYAVRELLKSAS